MASVSTTIRQPMTWCSTAALEGFNAALVELVGDGTSRSSWTVGLQNGQDHRGEEAGEMTTVLLGPSCPKRINIDVGSRGSGDSASFSFRASRFGFGELNVTASSSGWLESKLPIIRNELTKLRPRWWWIFGNVVTVISTLIAVPLVVAGFAGLMVPRFPLIALTVLAIGLFFCTPLAIPRLWIRDRPAGRGRAAFAWVWTVLASAVVGAVVSQLLFGGGR